MPGWTRLGSLMDNKGNDPGRTAATSTGTTQESLFARWLTAGALSGTVQTLAAGLGTSRKDVPTTANQTGASSGTRGGNPSGALKGLAARLVEMVGSLERRIADAFSRGQIAAERFNGVDLMPLPSASLEEVREPLPSPSGGAPVITPLNRFQYALHTVPPGWSTLEEVPWYEDLECQIVA